MPNNNLCFSTNTQLKLNNFFPKRQTHYTDRLSKLLKGFTLRNLSHHWWLLLRGHSCVIL